MSDSAQVISVNCNHCGASLQVPPDTRFVTCEYCHSQLEVRRSGGAAFTQVLESIDAHTKDIAADVGAIRLQNELERIDREWALERDRYRSADGREPEGESGIAGTIVLVIFGIMFVGFLIFWISSAASMGAPAIFPIMGVGMLLLFAVMVIAGLNRSSQFKAARERYEARRRSVLQAMSETRERTE